MDMDADNLQGNIGHLFYASFRNKLMRRADGVVKSIGWRQLAARHGLIGLKTPWPVDLPLLNII